MSVSSASRSASPDLIQAAPDFSGLVSHDRNELLDLVNELRNLGIDKWVDLPQLIVVGDQNSGKSSVLEAIAKVPFPRNDGLCTTFAIELRLHRSEVVEAPIVKLSASLSHDETIRQAIETFTFSNASIANLGVAVEAAKAHLQQILDKSPDSFLEDKLVFEFFDPANPSLTLIDLPGLIQIPNQNQDDQDVRVVESMIRAHMLNEKSIILAVVSAQSQVAAQKVVKWARNYDLKGERTLGIITKPDCLSRGSPLEDTFLNTAQNNYETFYMGLGWHVVKNLSFEECQQGLDRDTREQEWFTQHEFWANTIGARKVGTTTLKETLSGLLEDHVRRSLPSVIKDIRQHLTSCHSDIQKLGAARQTVDQQRQFLTEISEKFKHLIQLADQGMYGSDPFFTDKGSDMLSRNLRARIQKQNRVFSSVMCNFGHDIQHIELVDVFSVVPVDKLAIGLRQAAGTPSMDKRLTILATVHKVKDEFSATELDGTAGNPAIIRELFRLKSLKWQRIAEVHIAEVWEVAKNLLCAIAEHVTNKQTAQRLIRSVIHESMEDKRKCMEQKLQEVLAPHLRRHPITYNPAFTVKLNASTNYDKKGEANTLDKTAAFESELDILRYVEAYYEVTLWTFIDNVNVLVIEMCLLDNLASVFTPTSVSEMSPERLASLAADSDATIRQRRQLEDKLKRLEHAERQCSRHADYSLIDALHPEPGVVKSVINFESPKRPLPQGFPTGADISAASTSTEAFHGSDATFPPNNLFSSLKLSPATPNAKTSSSSMWPILNQTPRPSLFGPKGSNIAMTSPTVSATAVTATPAGGIFGTPRKPSVTDITSKGTSAPETPGSSSLSTVSHDPVLFSDKDVLSTGISPAQTTFGERKATSLFGPPPPGPTYSKSTGSVFGWAPGKSNSLFAAEPDTPPQTGPPKQSTSFGSTSF